MPTKHDNHGHGQGKVTDPEHDKRLKENRHGQSHNGAAKK